MSDPFALQIRPEIAPRPSALPTLRIAKDDPTSPVWSAPAPGDVLVTDRVLRLPVAALDAEIERSMIATLVRPIDPGERHADGNARRERELRAQLAALDVVPSFHLKRRLELDRADDPLCIAFRRISGDRRLRLLAFIGEARRRRAAGAR